MRARRFVSRYLQIDAIKKTEKSVCGIYAQYFDPALSKTEEHAPRRPGEFRGTRRVLCCHPYRIAERDPGKTYSVRDRVLKLES
jgi:hypothetical protein